MEVRSLWFFEAVFDIGHILPEFKAKKSINLILVPKDIVCQCVER